MGWRAGWSCHLEADQKLPENFEHFIYSFERCPLAPEKGTLGTFDLRPPCCVPSC
jgi:hypothetical protein